MRRYTATVALSLTLSSATALAAQADTAVSVFVDPTNPIPNVIANTIQADGGGIDWTAAALVVELDQGAVYNDPVIDGMLPQDGFWGISPELQWDTWVGTVPSAANGANDQGTLSAGDLGSFTLAMADQLISASWGGTSKNEIGPTRIGNISLTDDAVGTWSLAVTFAFSPQTVFLNNPVVNGEMVWDPMVGDLSFDGYVGIADLNILLGNWNQNTTPGDRAMGDPSGDGFVGLDDLGTALGNWNTGQQPRPTVDVIMGIPGDADGDGFVGITDKVNGNWNQFVTPGDLNARDTSGDGFVGLDDLNIMLSNWNAGTPPLVDATAPEPTSLGLLSAGCLILFRRRA